VQRSDTIALHIPAGASGGDWSRGRFRKLGKDEALQRRFRQTSSGPVEIEFPLLAWMASNTASGQRCGGDVRIVDAVH